MISISTRYLATWRSPSGTRVWPRATSAWRPAPPRASAARYSTADCARRRHGRTPPRPCRARQHRAVPASTAPCPPAPRRARQHRAAPVPSPPAPAAPVPSPSVPASTRGACPGLAPCRAPCPPSADAPAARRPERPVGLAGRQARLIGPPRGVPQRGRLLPLPVLDALQHALGIGPQVGAVDIAVGAQVGQLGLGRLTLSFGQRR